MGSFYQFLFKHEGSISTCASESRRCFPMVHVGVNDQASFINFAGELVFNEEVSCVSGLT